MFDRSIDNASQQKQRRQKDANNDAKTVQNDPKTVQNDMKIARKRFVVHFRMDALLQNFRINTELDTLVLHLSLCCLVAGFDLRETPSYVACNPVRNLICHQSGNVKNMP